MGHYVGSTTDNDNSAMVETKVLFDIIIQLLNDMNDPDLQELACVNSGERRPIVFGDLFHIDNCIVTAFSMLKAFGDTTYEARRQIHN